MKQLSHDVLERQYKEICSKWWKINDFDDFDHFKATYHNSIGGSIQPGVKNVVFMKDPNGRFDDSNTRWLAITCDEEESIPTWPAINGGPLYDCTLGKRL